MIDICNREAIIKAIVEVKPDIIYHTACHPYEGLSQFCPVDISETTLIGTLNVLTGAIKSHSVKRFVNFSSMARYGKGHHKDDGSILGPPYEEWYRCQPEDVYASAKVSAEECIRVLCGLHGIEWTNVIPHNVYGESNLKVLSDPYRGVIMIWVNSLLRGVPYYIYGDGEQKRAPSYIGDVVGPMALMGFSEDVVGQSVNIGADQEYSMNEISSIMLEEFAAASNITTLQGGNGNKQQQQSLPKPIHTENRPCEVKLSWCSHEKSKKLLDYKETTTLRQGIRNVIQWAQQVAPNGLQNRYLKELEIEELAPKTWTKKLI